MDKPEQNRKLTLRVALLQLASEGSAEKNAEKAVNACRSAKEQGADIALLPEMYSMGYDLYARPEEDWLAEAVSKDSPYVKALSDAARELGMAVGATLLEAYDPTPRNTLLLFDRHGREVLSYSKVHTCDFGPERRLTPGNAFPVCALDTAAGSVNVGAMICYDREFPESAWILMLHGAELILVPNACPMEQNRLAQLRGRAYENMTAIATCNYPDGEPKRAPDCNGHSTLFDGVAYFEGFPGSRDTCVLEADGGEGIFVGALDLSMLRTYRAKENQADTFRRPALYRKLAEEHEISPEFRRPGRRG
ncbi:MAG: carbon-nitrogen hydrolase family protein [Ruminococcaceae bacterium]|jgi:predicted amidohydrolase|nr:carbon-nitrogen hydrolase family protein [Oscillospiraceae bacterium]